MDKKDTINKVKIIIETITHNDSGKGFNYYKDLMYYKYNKDNDYSLIEEKMNNLILLMNKYELDNKLNILYDMDFETEIWDMI